MQSKDKKFRECRKQVTSGDLPGCCKDAVQLTERAVGGPTKAPNFASPNTLPKLRTFLDPALLILANPDFVCMSGVWNEAVWNLSQATPKQAAEGVFCFWKQTNFQNQFVDTLVPFESSGLLHRKKPHPFPCCLFYLFCALFSDSLSVHFPLFVWLMLDVLILNVYSPT